MTDKGWLFVPKLSKRNFLLQRSIIFPIKNLIDRHLIPVPIVQIKCGKIDDMMNSRCDVSRHSTKERHSYKKKSSSCF